MQRDGIGNWKILEKEIFLDKREFLLLTEGEC